MGIDIFNPKMTQLVKGMEGKTFLYYGTNSVGKTKQAIRHKKPYYLMLEPGVGATHGLPHAAITSWGDFLSVAKQFTPSNPKKLAQVKSVYQTIIVDGVAILGQLCADYVAEEWGVRTISEGRNGYGLWQEFSSEFEKPIRKLTMFGFTVVFISHESMRKVVDDQTGAESQKIYPAGDKRVIDPICDLVDFIVYLRPNGFDKETGVVIPSSAYLANSTYCHARSRFEGCPPYLPEFSVETMEQAVDTAVEYEAKKLGVTPVSYDEYYKTDVAKDSELSYSELVEQIKGFAMKMHEVERVEEYMAIVEQYLGKGKGVKDTDESQIDSIRQIYYDLKDLV